MAGEPLKVLIVDDSEVFRQVLRGGVLERFPSARVVEAEDWGPALDAARDFSPDVAIVDISLPGGSGFRLAPGLERLAPGVSIVFCSLDDLPHYRAAAARQGAKFWAKARLRRADFACLLEPPGPDDS